MSAYICSNKTFNRVTSFIDRHFDKFIYTAMKNWDSGENEHVAHYNKTKEQKQLFLTFLRGEMIKQNFKSVNARYKKRKGDQTAADYMRSFLEKNELCDALQFIKTLDCYMYQSSENKGWEKSKLRSMLRDFQLCATSLIRGMDEKEWE